MGPMMMHGWLAGWLAATGQIRTWDLILDKWKNLASLQNPNQCKPIVFCFIAFIYQGKGQGYFVSLH